MPYYDTICETLEYVAFFSFYAHTLTKMTHSTINGRACKLRNIGQHSNSSLDIFDFAGSGMRIATITSMHPVHKSQKGIPVEEAHRINPYIPPQVFT